MYSLPKSGDVVVIGAGIIGACTALSLTEAGLKVVVVDRGPIAGGTTGAGEGNIMVSDKEIKAEVILALRSRDAWFEMAERVPTKFELLAKGGLAVAKKAVSVATLTKLAEHQVSLGMQCEIVNRSRIQELEPHISKDVEFGIHYPQDGQCQPMLASAAILRQVRALGGQVALGFTVVGFEKSKDNQILGVITNRGVIATETVVSCAGTWASEIATMAGSSLPIQPRRGFILVTEPAPHLINHKVYDADYVANVGSDDASLQTSAVVEGTKSGTILIGASRERVGFKSGIDIAVLRQLAKQATQLFPVLSNLNLLRAYRGFRPFTPDHMPVIGPDASVKGLWHVNGHEGAGIGLAPGSAELIRDQILQRKSFMDPEPFNPARFAQLKKSESGGGL